MLSKSSEVSSFIIDNSQLNSGLGGKTYFQNDRSCKDLMNISKVLLVVVVAKQMLQTPEIKEEFYFCVRIYNIWLLSFHFRNLSLHFRWNRKLDVDTIKLKRNIIHFRNESWLHLCHHVPPRLRLKSWSISLGESNLHQMHTTEISNWSTVFTNIVSKAAFQFPENFLQLQNNFYFSTSSAVL